ncbi:phosphoribosylamine-glycine ligase [Kroppenstedtia sanguinis]|uniref:hypothetical protein n=1 Tax=Kroppenstedtia sanguinis TaxID=1380684 RepID=UPI003D1F8E8B
MSRNADDILLGQLREMISDEKSLTQEIVIKAVELASGKNLSVETLSKKLEREIDKSV